MLRTVVEEIPNRLDIFGKNQLSKFDTDYGYSFRGFEVTGTCKRSYFE